MQSEYREEVSKISEHKTKKILSVSEQCWYQHWVISSVQSVQYKLCVCDFESFFWVLNISCPGEEAWKAKYSVKRKDNIIVEHKKMFLIEVQMVVTLYVFTQDNCCLADPHLMNPDYSRCLQSVQLTLSDWEVAFKEVWFELWRGSRISYGLEMSESISIKTIVLTPSRRNNFVRSTHSVWYKQRNCAGKHHFWPKWIICCIIDDAGPNKYDVFTPIRYHPTTIHYTLLNNDK